MGCGGWGGTTESQLRQRSNTLGTSSEPLLETDEEPRKTRPARCQQPRPPSQRCLTRRKQMRVWSIFSLRDLKRKEKKRKRPEQTDSAAKISCCQRNNGGIKGKFSPPCGFFLWAGWVFILLKDKSSSQQVINSIKTSTASCKNKQWERQMRGVCTRLPGGAVWASKLTYSVESHVELRSCFVFRSNARGLRFTFVYCDKPEGSVEWVVFCVVNFYHCQVRMLCWA